MFTECSGSVFLDPARHVPLFPPLLPISARDETCLRSSFARPDILSSGWCREPERWLNEGLLGSRFSLRLSPPSLSSRRWCCGCCVKPSPRRGLRTSTSPHLFPTLCKLSPSCALPFCALMCPCSFFPFFFFSEFAAQIPLLSGRFFFTSAYEALFFCIFPRDAFRRGVAPPLAFSVISTGRISIFSPVFRIPSFLTPSTSDVGAQFKGVEMFWSFLIFLPNSSSRSDFFCF